MFKYGGCTHTYVDKHSKEGAVYVKSKTIEAAMLATKVKSVLLLRLVTISC